MTKEQAIEGQKVILSKSCQYYSIAEIIEKGKTRRDCPVSTFYANNGYLYIAYTFKKYAGLTNELHNRDPHTITWPLDGIELLSNSQEKLE